MPRNVLLTFDRRWIRPGRREAMVLWLVTLVSQICYCEKQDRLRVQQSPEAVAARVNGQPILVREVTR